MEIENRRILALLSDVDFSPQLFGIIQKLLERGAMVRIVLIGNSELHIAKEIQLRRWNLKNINQRGKFGSLFNFLLISLEIIRFRPETLFASGQFATIIGMLSAKFLNVPRRVFIRHHSNFHHKYKMKFGLVVDRLSNHLATQIAAVSEVVRSVLIQIEKVDKEKIIVIYNGVDLVKFKTKRLTSTSCSIDQFAHSRLFRIGVISRITEWKGVEYTATAFVQLHKEYPNSRLHIIGSFADSYSNVANILSSVASDAYVFENSNSDIPQFLQELDVFVHVPVGTDDEAFGIVFIEALASGVPCIFTQSGILNELKTPDYYTHLVRFRNSDEIYLNLKKLICSEGSPKIPVPESWLNQFSLEAMSTRYADLLLIEQN